MTRTGLRALAGFASAVDERALPPEVTEKAKACLLYALAVGIGPGRGADAGPGIGDVVALIAFA